MARIRAVTLAELNRLYPGRLFSVSLYQSGHVQSFQLVGQDKIQPEAKKTGTEKEPPPDAVDLAFNPPAGMLMPLPTEDQN